MKTLRVFVFALLCAMQSLATAGLVEGFDDLDHITIPAGQPTSFVTAQPSVLSFGVTMDKTQGTNLVKMVAGTTPTSNGDYASFAFLNRSIHLSNEYLIFNAFFANRDDVGSRDDYLAFVFGGSNGTLYRVFGATDAAINGNTFHVHTGWKSVAIYFDGDWDLNPQYLGWSCVNDNVASSSSYCGIDNLQISKILPTQLSGGIPVITPIADFASVTSPVTPVPEPETWTLMLLGLIGISAFRRGGKIFPPLAVAESFN